VGLVGRRELVLEEFGARQRVDVESRSAAYRPMTDESSDGLPVSRTFAL
jgi:hypothetical protein